MHTALMKINVSCFETLLHNARCVFHSKWTSCCNGPVSPLCVVKISQAKQYMLRNFLLLCILYCSLSSFTFVWLLVCLCLMVLQQSVFVLRSVSLRLCSRLTALWRYISLILLLLLSDYSILSNTNKVMMTTTMLMNCWCCGCQFDNIKRVYKAVEDMTGSLVDNIQCQFLLSQSLAQSVLCIVLSHAFSHQRLSSYSALKHLLLSVTCFALKSFCRSVCRLPVNFMFTMQNV